MTEIKLKVAIREKARRKKENYIPAILYGKEEQNKMFWLNSLEFEKVYRVAGESTLIDLFVEGEEQKPSKVLINDLQVEPVSGRIIHVDFYQVNMKEKLQAGVELKFVGEAPAVKELGGVLIKNIDTVEVRCLPADLPREIEINISSLVTFNDYIYAKDIPLDKNVEIDLNPDTVIAMVAPPRSKEELEDLEKEVEGDISQVEGMEEKTEEGEAEEGSEEVKGDKNEEAQGEEKVSAEKK